MRLILTTIFMVIVFILPQEIQQEPKVPSTVIPRSPSSLSSVATAYYCALKKGLELTSLKKINHDIGGVEKFAEKFIQENPCFRERATHFHLELMRLQSKLEKKYGYGFPKIPTLAHEFGEGEFKDLKPGVIWEYAVEAMDGKEDLALMMLSLCSPGVRIPMDGQSGINYRRLYENILGEKKRDIENKLAHTIDSSLQVQLRHILEEIDSDLLAIQSKETSMQKLNSLRNEFNQLTQAVTQNSDPNLQDKAFRVLEKIGEEEESINNAFEPRLCSGDLLLYIPKALGNEVDIPRELKARISKIQKRSLSSIGTKNYHILTGMLFGCVEKNCGLPSQIAAKSQGRLGAMYRALRLCNDTSANIQMKDFIEQRTSISFNQTKKVKEALFEMASNFSLYCGRESSLDKLCGVLYRLSDISEDNEKNRFVNRFIAEVDASILYQKWYLGGGKLFGLPTCTDIRIGGPKVLTDRKIPFSTKEGEGGERIIQIRNPCGIKAWSQLRCQNARAKLATWDIDIEWTKAQHEIGALFGASKCTVGFRFSDETLCKLPPLRPFELKSTRPSLPSDATSR